MINYLMNLIFPRLFIGYEMARAWLKHSVEEVGNFEFFLPALYRVFNGWEANSWAPCKKIEQVKIPH